MQQNRLYCPNFDKTLKQAQKTHVNDKRKVKNINRGKQKLSQHWKVKCDEKEIGIYKYKQNLKRISHFNFQLHYTTNMMKCDDII